jgi:Asp-tRNA(Asn)/Glu-tRNA(Gln) amidotransferase A subunit family amidase
MDSGTCSTRGAGRRETEGREQVKGDVANEPFVTASEMARAVRDRSVSPVELVDACFERIRRLNPAINAFVTLAEESARASAKRSEERVRKGEPIGPLEGVPIAIKDNTDTAGIRTTSGSRLRAEHVPAADAIVVERVKAAGAVVIGKTNTPEFAMKGMTDNPLFGHTRNPWDLAVTPFGSSGGSAAAVAAGLVPLAEGTDVAGSVRMPASACGIVGFKPSTGVVARVNPFNAWENMNVHGALARTVRDAALLLSVFAGPDARDPVSVPLEVDFLAECDRELAGLRLGWSPDLGYATVDDEVIEVTRVAARAFTEIGCTVADAGLDLAPYDPPGLFFALGAPLILGYRETLAASRHLLDPAVLEVIDLPVDERAAKLFYVNQRRGELWNAIGSAFRRHDLLLTPTVAVAPFPIASGLPRSIKGVAITTPVSWFPFTFPFNIAGLPAVSIPAGFSRAGLPIGIQIVGPRLADGLVMRAAAAFERLRPWAQHRPPTASIG